MNKNERVMMYSFLPLASVEKPLSDNTAITSEDFDLSTKIHGDEMSRSEEVENMVKKLIKGARTIQKKAKPTGGMWTIVLGKYVEFRNLDELKQKIEEILREEYRDDEPAGTEE